MSQHDFLREGWDARVLRRRLPQAGLFGYLVNGRSVRRLFEAERCEVLNAHYATGYGVLGSLSRVRPRIVSVWGSDVYDFPLKSRLHRWLVRWVLGGADAVASTSEAMARQVTGLMATRPISRAVALTPFGVDTARFCPTPGEPVAALLPPLPLVVGTVKTLSPKYGIDTLLKGFARLPATGIGRDLRLRIVGDGPERAALVSLARGLGLADRVEWIGAVPHADVPAQLRRLDVYVAASRLDSESFGVAVIEASACGLPVVVSDAGGLPEVVIQSVTGVVVPREDPDALAAALLPLLTDPALRARLGRAGRSHVQARYEWQACVQRMVVLYEDVLGTSSRPVAQHVAPAPKASAVGRASAGAHRPGRGETRHVGVIVPCRNEVDHVDTFMHALLAQQLPIELQLQIVVADGASDDGTRERLLAWATREPRLLVVDNPKRITSAALNLAVAASQGEVIVRMDVHTDYAADYVAQCVQVLHDSGATCVGGAWRPVGPRGRQRAIAVAFQSRFGSGGAASRRVDYTGPADTVYLGTWRRSELLRFGGFDETLVRNQDDELNLRILRGGGRVWQSAAIRSAYTPRDSFMALFRQFYQYGYWKVPVIRKHRLPAAPRQVLPFLFIALLAALAAAGLVSAESRWALAGTLTIYAAVALGSALALAPRQALGVAWAFACMHAGYGLGFGHGLIDFGLLRRAPGAAATRLTR